MTPNGSALHEAALCGKENVVKTLLMHGIDTEATDADGRTVLDLLMEFPPHVTQNMIKVIKKYRRRYEEQFYQNHSFSNSYGRNSYDQRDAQYGERIPSPSSPIYQQKYSKSLDRNSYFQNVSTKPNTPKKPPRRNLSVSPTHLDHGYTFSTFEGNSVAKNSLNQNPTACTSSSSADSIHSAANQVPSSLTAAAPYEFVYLAKSGNNNTQGNQAP